MGAVIELKKKLYDFMTMWLTMSLIFFCAEYFTEWLEVVTFGGLVVGSGVVGLFAVFGLALGRRVASKELYQGNLSGTEAYMEWAKALVVTAAFIWQGVLTICRVLPGYTMHSTLSHTVFLLLLLPLTGVKLHMLIKKKEQEHGN